ncbi:MAG: hypothetical protein L6R43_08245 [Planctomycetes bacterium]|nr:hypothetical protein [Planctomycetota bacterium]
MAIEASGRRDLSAPVGVVWASLKAVAPTFGKVKGTDEARRRVTISKGASLLSWGEEVAVEVAAVGPGMSRLTVTSAASVGTNIFADDENKKNTARILDAVERSVRGGR